ncbi:MAG TPA: crossover junction endodeoxyribonuclease RuvC [candidate division Zixibacteria bacterium]|jgi:crossover junction endodeoxyribonuclease RuvC
MKVFGIDPGLSTTGWAVIHQADDGVSLDASGAIRTDSSLPLPIRLLCLFEELQDALTRHRPQVVAIEEVFVARDARAALALGQARGAALLAASMNGHEVHSYSALEVKQSITGNGRASKEQVGYMVSRLLNLASAPKPADCADAAAIALCHLNRASIPDVLRASERPRVGGAR